MYLWDDFSVVRSPVRAEEGVLWQNVTPEWEAFCKETLGFEIPDDLRYAYAQEEQVAASQGKEASETRLSAEEGASDH